MKRRCLCLLLALTMCLSVISVMPVVAEDYATIAETSYGGNRYVLYDKALTWYEAKAYCESIGGHLVTIGSADENNAVKSLIQNGSHAAYFIGGNDATTEGTWEWTTGESWNYSNWNSGEPNNSNGEDYASIVKASGLWNDLGSTSTYGFVCEFDNFTPVKTITHNGHTYQIFNNSVSWEYAKKYCQLKGGHLATITDESENNAITNALGTSGKFYWLGATDEIEEGKWRWVTGEEWNYSNWNSGQPDNAGSTEHYLHMYTASSNLGKWNDIPNSYSGIGFICEFDVEIIESGTCGDNVTWTLGNDGTLFISGSGAMEDFGFTGDEWSEYYNIIKTVVISEGITRIGGSAFILCEELQNVILPNTLVSIGKYAFVGCLKLEKIVLPQNTKQIDISAFEAASALETIEIPESISEIGNRAFYACDSLSDVYFSGTENQWNSITVGAYNNSLQNANVHYNSSYSTSEKGWSEWSEHYPYFRKNVRSRTEYSYRNRDKTESSSSSLGGWILDYKIESGWSDWLDIEPTNDIYRKKEERTLWHYTRYYGWNSEKEKYVSWPWEGEHAKTYQESGWRTSQLENRGIADDVDATCYKDIDDPISIWWWNESSKKQWRYNDTTYYYYKWSNWSDWSTTPQTAASNKEVRTRTVYSYQLIAEEPTISDVEQYNGTFVTLTSSTPNATIRYTLDGSIPSDENGKYYTTGEPIKVKESCTLKAITTSEGYMNSDVVSKDYTVNLGDEKYLTFDFETGKITGCDEDAISVTIPPEIEGVKVTGIADNAFDDAKELTKVVIPSGVTEIGKYAFNNLEKLKDITISDTVTTIGEYAFSGCKALTNIELPNSITSIDNHTFSNCTNLASINIPNKLATISSYMFENNSKLANITIPDSVVIIEDYAFSGCSALKEVIVPNSVTTIKSGTFANCSSLTMVTIPDSVTTIGTSIFAYIRDNVTVKCYLDTTAHKKAVEEGIKVELMPWGVLQKPTLATTPVNDGLKVSISAPKGTIYYTTNGTEPTVLSSKYSNPISVNRNNLTIKAVAIADGWTNSETASLQTNVQRVAKPYASTGSGKVVKGTKIELYCDTEGAEIWYTTDGYTPQETDIYTGAFEITEDITEVMVVAVKDGMFRSQTALLTYEISKAEDVPVVTTLDAINITETSATVSAEIDANGGDIRMVEFVYYEKNNSTKKLYATSKDNKSAVLTGLSPDTEYWYQARALNEIGWQSGYIKSFKTDIQGVIKPASIEIEPSYISMNVGKKKTLLATVLPMAADNREVYWSSEDTSVATVDENGIVTAVGLGNTRIKATTISNRLVAYCNVDVISTNVRGEFDFSEHNMITNSSSYDEYGFDHNVNAGGNALMASAYLARWDGVILEENDTYPSSPDKVKYQELDADYHVQNIIYLPYRADNLDNDEIKKAIMKYGAVYTAFKVNYNYFDGTETNYCLPSNVNKIDGGHAVVIVGWDDNYSRSNFVSAPDGDGAFICKNSWGTSSGEEGYFYVSYYDKHIAKATCGDMNAVFYNVESTDNYNKIYQYDYLGPTVIDPDFRAKKIYVANAFPEKGNVLEQDEQLKAVSFYNHAPGTTYEIYVVTNFEDKNSLTSLGSPVVTGISEYAGYFTVNLDNAIELKKGTRFAVVVKYTSLVGDVRLYVELPTTLSNGSSHSSNAKANLGESFMSMNAKSWEDYAEFKENGNLCIKAFTDTGNSVMLMQAIDNVGREYESDKTYTIKELIDEGFEFNPAFVEYMENTNNIALFSTEEEINLGSMPPSILPDLNTNNNYSEGATLPTRYDLRDEECMTSVKNQGEIGSCWAFATYASLESSLKKASFLSSGSADGGLNQATSGASSITLNTTGTMLSLGNTVQLEATIYPADSTAEILWESSNNSIVSVSSHGLVRALGVGNATVTAKTVDGKVSAQCAITVTSPVPVSSISINNTESDITAGNKILMDYTVYPENAGDKNIIWSVDNTQIASINEYGLLSATGGGTVTVTATSSDGNVSESFTLNIDDGMPCNIEITENNLGVYDTNIFGDLTANVTNKTSETMNATVIMSIYDSRGKLVTLYSQDETLAVGDNPIEFSRKYISGLADTKFSVKVFVWSDKQKLKPLAAAKESAIE